MNTELKYDKKFLARLKNNYFMARAMYETVKEMAEEIEKNILATHEFYESEEWTERMTRRGGNGVRKRILEPFDSYLMNEADYQEYLDLCYEQYKVYGIDDPRGREWCPDAQSRALYKETERELIDYAISILPKEMTSDLKQAARIVKYREQMLDIILKLECQNGENSVRMEQKKTDKEILAEQIKSFNYLNVE